MDSIACYQKNATNLTGMKRGYKMDLLIIGGTSFVGRHLVENAVGKGHKVTLFNRGKSNPGLFPDLPRITGDRKKDASKLKGHQWDAVIDTSAYTPADLAPVMDHLETAHYTFISTISVYDDYSKGPAHEKSSVFQQKIEGEEVTGASYGPLKVMCEQLVHERMPGKALIIRPGIVVGPFDPTDRFTFWAKRLAENNEILVPGSKKRKVQWIDARDLAEFTISLVEKKVSGIFNVAADPLDMEAFVDEVRTANCGKLVWIEDAFLQEQNIAPFQIPLWIPISSNHPEGFLLVDNSKAKAAGLSTRSAGESAEETREWLEREGQNELKVGLDAATEKRLIEKHK